MLEREDAPVKHLVQAIAGRDLKKCEEFAKEHCPNSSPKLYDSYQAVYDDPDVDVVYIGTPHAFHKRDILDAIAAGKNILCEKPLTINAREAKEVFDAAKSKGVYLHEAMWLRHRPLVHKLRKLLHDEKVIGDVYRTFVDYALEIDIDSLPSTSRHNDLSLGAGTLLDSGIYSLTWAILTLDAGSPASSEKPLALGMQSHQNGIERNTSILLQYPSTGRQGIVTSTSYSNGHPTVFATIWGRDGVIEVEGPVPALPFSFTVYPKLEGDPTSGSMPDRGQGQKYDFPKIGSGFVYEADNTALDILAGRKESPIMPWSETAYVALRHLFPEPSLTFSQTRHGNHGFGQKTRRYLLPRTRRRPLNLSKRDVV